MNDKQNSGSPSGTVSPGRDQGNGHPRRRTPWQTFDGRVISLVSRKGGVGKTTSAVNLGAALALSGHTVLVVGVDPQCGVCRSLGTQPEALSTGLGEIFSHRRSLTDLVQTSPLRDLFFVSPRIDCLSDEEDYLSWLEERPDDFVREIDQARFLYDTILIDCPPNLGPATRAALLASDSYLVPIQAEELCRGTVEHLLDFVGDFRDRNFPSPVGAAPSGVRPLALEGLFLTMTSSRTRMGRHVAQRVAQDFGNLLFAADIPRTTRLSEMALRGKPAVIYDRRSCGSRAYFDLADEMVYRFLREKEGDDPAAETDTALSRGLPGPLTAGADKVASRPAPDPEEAPDALPGSGDSLERLFAELGGSREGPSWIPAFEEPASPEMVSLDDLLAEEESGDPDGEDWEDDSWPIPRRPH